MKKKGAPVLRFGKGKQNLVIITGALNLLYPITWSWMTPHYFSYLTSHFTVYVVGINELSLKCNMNDIAQSYLDLLDAIATPVSVIAFSGGSYIAEYLAILRPNFIEKIILVSATIKSSQKTKEIIYSWMQGLQESKWRRTHRNILGKFSNEKLMPLCTSFFAHQPKHINDLIIYLQAFVKHDAIEIVKRIKCPTLIMGGNSDMLVTENQFQELMQSIFQSELLVIPNGSHNFYLKNKFFFQSNTLNFLLR